MRPTDPDAQVSLGNLLFQKGRIDDAISHYQKAITLRPDYFLARYGLGHALLEKGELDSAIQVCRSALLLRPLDADCHTTLAIALEEKGNPAEAMGHYQKALELAPSSVPTLTNLAWLLATSRDASLRNGSKAVELAKQADRLIGGTNALYCAPSQPRMRRTANSPKRLELPVQRCNSRGCTARTLSRRKSINRSCCTNWGCRTERRRNRANSRMNVTSA